MQPRFDFPAWEALYREEVHDAEWPVRPRVESPMDIVKRELWIQENPPAAKGVPVDYFLFGLGEPSDPSCTKFGGVPYRSRKLPWPKTDEGMDCDFLAQINFSASKDLLPDLPSELLLIFLTWEDGASTEDYYFEWGSPDIADPMTAADVPEQGVVEEIAFCELHRSAEFPDEEYEEGHPMNCYSNLSVSKIGGVSDYFGDAPPELPGRHLFTIGAVRVFKGEPFPFLNRHAAIPPPTQLGGSHVVDIYMPGDLGESYFYWDGNNLHVETRCY